MREEQPFWLTWVEVSIGLHDWLSDRRDAFEQWEVYYSAINDLMDEVLLAQVHGRLPWYRDDNDEA